MRSIAGTGLLDFASAMRRLLYACLLPLTLSALTAGAQPVVEEDETFTPKNHAVLTGAHIHTFGIGVDLQYRRKYRDDIDLLFSLSVASFKDPTEARILSAGSSQGGVDYVFDKRNHAYFFGMTAGAQYVLVPRTEFSRVQVSAGLGGGPVFVVLKPYLLEVIRDLGNGFAELAVEPYQGPEVHDYFTIFGQAQYLQRFDLVTTQWGLRLRGDVTVDFSGNSYFVRALHLGFQGDFFGKAVPILFEGRNRSVFWGVFAGFVIGNAWE